MKHWLVSCQHTEDLMQRVEAPDTEACGLPRRRSWDCLAEIGEGDRIWFRDARRDRLVGLAQAKSMTRRPHTHDDGCPVARHWTVRPLGSFKVPISRPAFNAAFREGDDGTAGFALYTREGTFVIDHYCYPLAAGVTERLARLARFTHDRFTLEDACSRDVLATRIGADRARGRALDGDAAER